MRTLGVHIIPTLQWDAQFKKMQNKLQIVIAKLNNITIYP